MAIGLALVALAPGCMTAAEQAASDGLTAFKNCDLRTASQDFEKAHNMDSTRPDFALAYALSTLAVLPEDPHVTSVLQRLGFTSGIDTSAYWGTGGVFDQLSSRMTTCQSVNDFMRSHLPYPPAQKNGPTAVSAIKDPTLTGDDFVAAARLLTPRLEELSSALETAADGAGAGTDIEGGCGVGQVHVEAPELYGLAALIEATRGAIEAAGGYDWGVPATLALEQSPDPALANSLNSHVLHVRSASAVAQAAPVFLHAVRLFETGLERAAADTARPANSLFNWSAMPPGAISDLQTLASVAEMSLTTSGLRPIPFCSPLLQVDALSFFDAPIDATNLQPPIWSAMLSDPLNPSAGYTLNASAMCLDSEIAAKFSPDPTMMGASFMFSLPHWQNTTSAQWTAVFDPDKRWENLYGCN
jgi:hypothetical protein